MSDQPADLTAITAATVKSGMGYPNDRLETSPTPIGWQGLGQINVTHVSRETSERK